MAKFKVTVKIMCAGVTPDFERNPEAIEDTDALIVHDGSRAMWERTSTNTILWGESHNYLASDISVIVYCNDVLTLTAHPTMSDPVKQKRVKDMARAAWDDINIDVLHIIDTYFV